MGDLVGREATDRPWRARRDRARDAPRSGNLNQLSEYQCVASQEDSVPSMMCVNVRAVLRINF